MQYHHSIAILATHLCLAGHLSVPVQAQPSPDTVESTESTQVQTSRLKRPDLILPDTVFLVPDIAYGKGGDSVLLGDLFLPKTAPTEHPLPVMLYIHGGAWRKGDRTLRHRCAAFLAERGIAGLSIDYRLSGEATFPAQIFDCKAAVRWLRANSKRLQIDPDRIGVCGGSAGGHLAALMATTGNLPEFEGDGGNPGLSTEIQAAVLFYGVYDMETPMADDLGRIVSQFLSGTIQERPNIYRQASPIHHITDQCPPCLVLYGDRDREIFASHSRRFVDALRKVNVKAELVVAKGRRHAYDLDEPDLHIIMQPVERFLFEHFNLVQRF